MVEHAKAAEKKDQPKEPQKELAKEQPKMQLEKSEQFGNWEYWRDPWLYGPEIMRNGVLPLDTVERADAEAYVNRLYPGSFPEPTEQKTSTKEEHHQPQHQSQHKPLM